MDKNLVSEIRKFVSSIVKKGSHLDENDTKEVADLLLIELDYMNGNLTRAEYEENLCGMEIL
jgi:hypothetical protein